ncbi:hypothetical protein [Rhodopseudomonas sp. B29]|uniref:hypothetical protein n=1 Tax=Rhodopseudomonas sp. B29 TaxID=95607 RepID=UPI00034BE716|nr:hypothetical protein [Rhodopseudomonas sp. B29]
MKRTPASFHKPPEELLELVRALAKRAAREDHARDLARREKAAGAAAASPSP